MSAWIEEKLVLHSCSTLRQTQCASQICTMYGWQWSHMPNIVSAACIDCANRFIFLISFVTSNFSRFAGFEYLNIYDICGLSYLLQQSLNIKNVVLKVQRLSYHMHMSMCEINSVKVWLFQTKPQKHRNDSIKLAYVQRKPYIHDLRFYHLSRDNLIFLDTLRLPKLSLLWKWMKVM